MKLRGLTPEQVDLRVTTFYNLMMKGMTKACKNAASFALTADATDGELTFAMDSLSVISTQWGEYTAGTLMPELTDIAVRAGEVISSPLGNMPTVNTQQFIADMTNMVTSFSNDMWKSAQTALMSGVQDGASIVELGKAVEQVANVKAKKARVIAQTAVIAAVNGGEWQQMMEAASLFDIQGVKEWESTEDSHTRPTHHEADGQRVPIDGHFVVGGSFLMFPGDPSGAPEEIISCRCTTLYDLDIEDQITASQTSPETLSDSPAVDTNGLTAAFDPLDHPRGKNGKFIEKGAVGDVFKNILAGKHEFHDLNEHEKSSFVSQATHIGSEEWDNLTDVQKENVHTSIDKAIDEGVPGSAMAQSALDELDDVDHSDEDHVNIFNPDEELPGTEPVSVVDAMTQANQAFKDKEINVGQLHTLGEMISNGDGQAIVDQLESYKKTNFPSTPSVPVVSTPLTTGSVTPIKITHGLIHAKHNPGDVIAQSDDWGDGEGIEIKWNGTSYDIAHEDGSVFHGGVKKSKLYATLNSPGYSGIKWHKPGKQETEVSHATPLDAAPPPEPIPHPISSAPTSGLLPNQAVGVGMGIQVVENGSEPAMYSTNGKYKISKNMSGETIISKKQPDGLWGESTSPSGSDAPMSLKWKNTESASPDLWPTTPGLTNDNSDPFSSDQTDVIDALIHIHDTTPITIETVHEVDAPSGIVDMPDEVMMIIATDGTSASPVPKSMVVGGAQKLTQSQWDSLSLSEQEKVFTAVENLEKQDYGGATQAMLKLKGFMANPSSSSPSPTTSSPTPSTWDTMYDNVVTNSAYSPSIAPLPGTVPSSTTAADVPGFMKKNFYDSFKSQNVSPAWSAKKIYESMHAAKLAQSGNPQIAGLNDAEMLKLLDSAHLQYAPGAGGDTYNPPPVYSEKVKTWLKTPNGQKAFKELNPAIATPPPSVSHAVKKTAKKAFVGKTAGKKIASSASSISVEDALGDVDPPMLSDPKKKSVYSDFKKSTYGKYLDDKPEQIYWNSVQQAKTQGLSEHQLLQVVDEEGAKKFGVANTHAFMTKVKDWLATPSGKKKAAEIKAGTWAPSTPSYSSSSYSSHSYAAVHPANTPLNEKIPPLNTTVEPFDPTKKYNWHNKYTGDFPVINDAKAKQMTAAWSAQQGTMTATQKAALRKYSGSSYHAMNGYLRGDSGATEQIHQDVQNAQAGMRLSLEPIVLHRGNGWFKGWGSVAEVKSHLGEDFHQEAFFSASIGGKSAFSGNINFVIECPPGTPMAYVDTFSLNKGEDEMLLGGNLTYKVVEVIDGSKAPDGSQHYGTQVTVRLRVIPPSENQISYGSSS
jgi:hypothetical protein